MALIERQLRCVSSLVITTNALALEACPVIPVIGHAAVKGSSILVVERVQTVDDVDDDLDVVIQSLEIFIQNLDVDDQNLEIFIQSLDVDFENLDDDEDDLEDVDDKIGGNLCLSL